MYETAQLVLIALDSKFRIIQNETKPQTIPKYFLQNKETLSKGLLNRNRLKIVTTQVLCRDR